MLNSLKANSFSRGKKCLHSYLEHKLPDAEDVFYYQEQIEPLNIKTSWQSVCTYWYFFIEKAVTDSQSQQARLRRTGWVINTLCTISKLTNNLLVADCVCVCVPCCSSTLPAVPGLFGIVSIGSRRGQPGRRQMAGVHTWYRYKNTQDDTFLNTAFNILNTCYEWTVLLQFYYK